MSSKKMVSRDSKSAKPRELTQPPKKEVVIKLRVTVEQKAQLDVAAERSGLPLAAWLRAIALEGAREARAKVGAPD